jgi:hypothetical protein
MPQPFWEVELAKQHGKLINAAMDYSPESRTAPVFAMPRTAPCWQPPPTVRPVQTYAPASRSAPVVFSHAPVAPQSTRMAAPAWTQTSTVRPPAARTASRAGDGDASDGLPVDLGAKSKPLQHPPGWLAGTLIVVAAYVGNQLRHPAVPPMQASASKHAVVPAHTNRAKAK